MARKTTIPKTLPLRSSGWTRFRWLASGAAFKSSAWVTILAVVAGVVWSQWGIIQPAAAAGIREVAIAILGEDVVGESSPDPTTEARESILEPATAKQRQALTDAIEGVDKQITATGTTLPESSYAVLKSVVADCEGLILDPSIQTVSVVFCTQQITTETAALKKATDDEIARVAAEKEAADKAAAEEAARKAAEEEAARQNEQNSGGGDQNNGGSDDGGYSPPPPPQNNNPTVTWTLTCGGVVQQTIQAPLNASPSASGNCVWTHD